MQGKYTQEEEIRKEEEDKEFLDHWSFEGKLTYKCSEIN